MKRTMATAEDVQSLRTAIDELTKQVAFVVSISGRSAS